MPLSVNIGLSKKMSRDYQSTGLSINLTAELDATLLTKPDELQAQVQRLYAEAEGALQRQAANMSPPRPTSLRRITPRPSENGRRRFDGNNGGGFGPQSGEITDSQRRCINRIATRLNVDPHQESVHIVGVELHQLTVRQASELIDHLRSRSPSQSESGR